MTSRTRLTSLDGLRGIAASVVMVYHLSLVARPFIDTQTTGDVWWWLTRTPLKLFTAGTESVLVFFVLSGLVVALPALRGGFGWAGYYGTRLLRLYLPVWGALAFGALLIALLPRDLADVTSGSWVAGASATSNSWQQWVSEASLWRATYKIDNVLWSLRWELVFSLTLPLFVIVARAIREHWQLAAALAGILTIIGRLIGLDALVYLPVFFLGTLMAARLPELVEWSVRRGRLFWMLLTTASFALLIASWLARPLETSLTADLLWGLAGLGAAGLVIVAIGSPLAKRMLSAAVPRWLGRVSFSLYLVQAPIIATLAFALGDSNWVWVTAVGIPLCLLAAWGFHTAVEKPSQRLARFAGGRLQALSVRVRTSATSRGSGQQNHALSRNERDAPQFESTDRMLPAGSRNQAISGP